MSIAALIHLIQHGTQEIIAFLIFQSLFIVFFVLLLCGILEEYLKVKDNKRTTMSIGFLYGFVVSILLSGATEIEILMQLVTGCIFSVGSLIFAMVRGQPSS